jgi:ubiquinone/menaquinone biosynthesis C-methylase UbiE
MKTEDLAKRVFGNRAALYATGATHTDPRVLQRVVELSAPQAHWSALDIATGTGHTALALAPHVASVIGIDLTPRMLAEAERLRVERGATNVTFQTGDVHRLAFPDASFDLITCRLAAHHFSDIRWALGEMRRVLGREGRLVIDDRSVPEDDFVDGCMNALDRLHDESHVRQYRPSEWRSMLAEAGFTVHLVEPYVRHRPLTALTDGVSPEDVARIQAMLASLDEAQRAALNLAEVAGQPYLNHWYVLIVATRAAEPPAGGPPDRSPLARFG